MGTAVYLYHATRGPELFDSDSLPAAAEGWHDAPEKAHTDLRHRFNAMLKSAHEALQEPLGRA